tara:strand:- start:1384 stop:1584 length:201 start_codon:yes stop_codon:yes gene_type:complete
LREPNLAQRARAKTQLTQRAFADLISVSFVTIARWETDKVCPTGAAFSLLKLVEAHPKNALRVLKD